MNTYVNCVLHNNVNNVNWNTCINKCEMGLSLGNNQLNFTSEINVYREESLAFLSVSTFAEFIK